MIKIKPRRNKMKRFTVVMALTVLGSICLFLFFSKTDNGKMVWDYYRGWINYCPEVGLSFTAFASACGLGAWLGLVGI